MDKIFGTRQKPVKEQIRENKRQLTRSGRDMDKEIANLQRQEKLVQADIKKALKKGDERTAKILAKQIVQMRQQQQRLMATKGTMTAISHKQTSMGVAQTMNSAIGTSANIMGKMNAQMDVTKMSQIMQNFQKQNDMAGMKEEMMDDVIDGMFGDDLEDEADQAMDEILDSIGIDLGNKLGSVETGRSKLTNTRQQVQEEDEDLEAMLARLKQ